MSDERLQGEGDCYLVAGHLIMDADDADGYVLCHGTATGQGPIAGVAFDHAWVEKAGMAIDKSNGLDAILPVESYYAIGDVRDVVRYTPTEARQMMREHGHFGPWHFEWKEA